MEGIKNIDGANAAWMDPVAVLSGNYTHFELSRNRYFSRTTLDDQHFTRAAIATENMEKGNRKRKRKRKKPYAPNEKERMAEIRHQEARLAILKAHSSFVKSSLSKVSSRVTTGSSEDGNDHSLSLDECQAPDLDFRQMAGVWQAPLYEINILKGFSKAIQGGTTDDEVSSTSQLFNCMIENREEETLAKCAEALFLLPGHSRFLISDVAEARQLIPPKIQDSTDSRYTVIVIDPPWENKSVYRKSIYPLIPNRQLFSLPIKELAHPEGCLVALWLTNREKLHQFVENELFPAWGVELVTSWYWLKLNASGDMISPLDLQHHKPYECLLLGYLFPETQERILGQKAEEISSVNQTPVEDGRPPEKFVVMSVPGDHSRKPPIGSLLAPYAPGPKPINGLELFARELHAGWTSWGNEPLHFQHMKYFVQKS